MRFQFDPAKANDNLKKHKVSFADAEGVLMILRYIRKIMILKVNHDSLQLAWGVLVKF
jgi:uncharacterized DUF497 family protein